MERSICESAVIRPQAYIFFAPPKSRNLLLENLDATRRGEDRRRAHSAVETAFATINVKRLVPRIARDLQLLSRVLDNFSDDGREIPPLNEFVPLPFRSPNMLTAINF